MSVSCATTSCESPGTMICSTPRRDMLETGSSRGAMVHLVLLLACCCLLPIAAAGAQQSTGRNVLVIFSSDKQLAANVEVERGLRESFSDPIDREVDFFTEFLDDPAFAGEAYEQTVATYLRDKYALRKPEVLVAGGRPALDFLLRHRARLFPDVPVVHLAVSRSAIAAAQPLPANVVGVPVDYDFGGTIRQALRWHPATRRLVVVTGAGESDRRLAAETRATIAGLDLHVPGGIPRGPARRCRGEAPAPARHRCRGVHARLLPGRRRPRVPAPGIRRAHRRGVARAGLRPLQHLHRHRCRGRADAELRWRWVGRRRRPSTACWTACCPRRSTCPPACPRTCRSTGGRRSSGASPADDAAGRCHRPFQGADFLGTVPKPGAVLLRRAGAAGAC